MKSANPESRRAVLGRFPVARRAEELGLLVYDGLVYTDLPFAEHAYAVADLALEHAPSLGIKPEMAWAVGFLHDALETNLEREFDVRSPRLLSLEGIEVLLGENVNAIIAAGCVGALTGRGENRAARVADWTRKLRECPWDIARLVKVADRVCNLETSAGVPVPGLCRMYVREHPGFETAVADGLLPDDHPLRARLRDAFLAAAHIADPS